MDTQKLTVDLARDEGFVSHAYQDGQGYWTIGFGRLIDQDLAGGISEDEAMVLLGNDIKGVEADLDRNIPWWRDLPEPAARGLLNMCFNMGWPRLSGFKKMLAALEAGDCAKAADEALDSVWAGQVGERSERIANLYRSSP